MLDEQKHNSLKVNKDDRPSRFLVDLIEIQNAEKRSEEEKKQINFFNFLRLFKPDKKQARASGNLGRLSAFKSRIEQLAFFPFIKIFYKFCYRIGWTTLFVVKFFYILFKKLMSPALKALKTRRVKKKSKPLPKSARANFELSQKILKNNINSEQTAIRAEPNLSDEIYLDDGPVDAYREKILPKEAVNPKANGIFEKEEEIKRRFDWEDDLARSLTQTRSNGKPSPWRLWPKIYFGRLKPVVTFALVLMILALPMKAFTSYRILKDFRGQVLGASEEAITDLKSASARAANSDFTGAQDNFTAAQDKFKDLKDKTGEISSILNILSPLIPNDNIKLAGQADYILEAGRQAAILGSELTYVFSGLKENEWDTEEFMDILQTHLERAGASARVLNDQLSAFDISVLPENYQPTFTKLKNLSNIAEKSLVELNSMAVCAKNILGFEKDTRYLFVFQNNAELRASGGFIGSLALVDFRSGEIKNMEVPGGGSYDTEGGLKERIISPSPLHLVDPLWHFWDANWWPDWPSSARKLEWFYEKSGGPTVDGVIAVTPTVMERILSIIGPLDMQSDYGVTITADNFWQITQEFAETKPALCTEDQVADGIDGCVSTSSLMRIEPKKIINDLLNKIIEEFPKKMNKENLLKLITAMDASLREKHILLYFNDKDLEEKIRSFGWDGGIKDTAWDYLMVVNTNIAGQKTDRVIKENIDHEAEVSEDGSIINTLKITRVHNGVKGTPFTGVRNVDWVRVYVPLGSVLLDASGFTSPDKSLFEKPDEAWQSDPDLTESEGVAAVDIKTGTKIYTELGKTVFANWSMLDPGKTVVLYLKYKLPFKLNKKIASDTTDGENNAIPYALLAQKQPGSLGVQITSRLELPDDFKISWKYPDELKTVSNSWYVNDNLDTDKFWAVLIDTN